MKLAKSQVYSLNNPNKILTTEYGLVSNFVYGAVQDDDGFMWFYTDKGVSKFDGFFIKNFTTADGLASTNIWLTTKDINNKLWLYTHDNYLSYISGDSIFIVDSFKYASPINLILRISPDTLLVSRRFLEDHFYLIGEKKPKILLYTQLNASQKNNFNNKFNIYNSTNYDSIAYLLGYKNENNNDFNGGFSFTFNNIYYSLSKLNNYFYAYSQFNRNGILIKSRLNNRFYWPILNGNQLLLSGTDGLRIFNQGKIIQFFKINTKANILRSFKDTDKNIWTGTQAKGIFFYNLKLTSQFSIKFYINNEIVYSSHIGNQTLLECENQEILFFNNLNSISKHVINNSGIRECGIWFDDKVWVHGNSNYMLYDLNTKQEINFIRFNKELSKIDKSYLWIPYFTSVINKDSILSTGSNTSHLITRVNGKFKIKLIFNSKNRIFSTYLDSNKIFYINTLNNLYIFDKNYNLSDSIPYTFSSNKLNVSVLYKFFNKKILLAGTNGLGIYQLISNNNWIPLDRSENLQCKNIFSFRNYLIAHTNKGIFSYIYKDGDFIFNTVYANSYGLNPDDIKLVYPYNDSIHVVTKNSILAFSPNLIDTTKDTLKVYECFIDNRKIALDKLVIVPYDFNQLSFRFSTFNYTRMDDTKFRYRLKNSDQWINLERNLIELSQLAPGTYNIDIEAYNKFSNEIFATASVPMIVETPWYKTISFLLAMNSLIIGILGVSIWQIYRRRIENQQRINKLNNDINEVKLQALESQMNPHFVYNALASIQYYIQENNIRNAELYLTEFAKLIRSFLTATRNQGINLNDEIILLRRFLELEIMRFDYRFKFNIEVDQTIPLAKIKIPPLLLQPFLENSIQHGLFHRQKNGFIEVKFKMIGQDLYIELTDNGIGIDISKSLPNYKNIKGTSSALSIFKEKIETINKLDQYKISYSIEPLYPDEVEFKGTKIAINFHNIKEKYDDLND